MNREILFRGKHIHALSQNKHLDGIWVYGYLCDENYINTVDEDEYGGEFTSEMLIDSETVCQYTGLTDNTKWEELSENEKDKFLSEWNKKEGRQNVKEDWNGRKIFEEDIVSAHGNRYVVFWDECNCEIGIKNNEERFGIAYAYPGDMKVIGNIFDNLELLKE